MPSISSSYKKCGRRAALLGLVPGLGQFRNRQYAIGVLTIATIGVLLLWICWLSMLQLGSQHSNLSTARACFLLWTLVVWLASIIHAYTSAIRRQKEINADHSVDLAAGINASNPE